MYDYIAAFTHFLARLEANPRIKIAWKEFALRAEDYDPYILREGNASLGKDFGGLFPLPEEELQLLGLPAPQLDIAWNSTAAAQLPAGIALLTGCISLVNVGEAINALRYGKDPYAFPKGLLELMNDATLMRHGRLFDTGSAANVTSNLAYVCYDQAQRRFWGLGLEHGRQFLPLQLSLGEYVRAALAWHGGWGWQFLYTPLEDFRRLDGSTLLTLYDLYDGLPALFPDADWSIIATKKEYFDIARPAALHYRATRARS